MKTMTTITSKGSNRAKNDSSPSKSDEWHEFVETGPGTPMGTLLRKFWQPVALSKDIEPGKAVPIRVMTEELTLYRGHSGQPYIVALRCAHRLTFLHTGWVEGECIRCRYHGWRYDGNGQCVEMPAEDASFPAKVKIVHYPAADYAGLVFAYFGEGEPPEMRRFAELERDYGVTWAAFNIWPCNWFQRLENVMDQVHVGFVHREAHLAEALSSSLPTVITEETVWGLQQTSTRAGNSDNKRIGALSFPNNHHVIIPTPVLSKAGKKVPWTDLINWLVPIDDTHAAMYKVMSAPIRDEAAARDFSRWLTSAGSYDWVAHEDELFRGIMPGEYESDSGTMLLEAQDFVTQVGQGAVVDRSQERLGKSDEGIILLRKIFRRELAAIKSASAGKSWRSRKGFAHLPVPRNVPPAPDPLKSVDSSTGSRTTKR